MNLYFKQNQLLSGPESGPSSQKSDLQNTLAWRVLTLL
jgi:hypothetical protein